jgi:aspartate racemase
MENSGSFKELAGIIGGVGPEATNYFTSLLVKLRLPYSSKDQDHIPYLLFNNPQIPDRTDYLFNKTQNPLPELIKTGIALKNAGATFLVMPCNTAHVFARDIETAVGLPFINMIDQTALYIRRKYGNSSTVGILATSTTVRTKLFQHALLKKSKEFTVLTPDDWEQELIMQGIYDIKSNSVNKENRRIFTNAAHNLAKRGATVIILGCTEIPLVMRPKYRSFFRIDPMEILAQKVIERTLLSASNKKSPNFYIRSSVR